MGFWGDVGNLISDTYHAVNPFDAGAGWRTEREDRAEQEAYKAQGLTPPERLSPDARRKQRGTSSQYAQKVASGQAQIDPFRKEYNFSGGDFVKEYAQALNFNKQKEYDLLFPSEGEDGVADFRNLVPGKQNYGSFLAGTQIFKNHKYLGAKRVYTQNLQAIANDELHPENQRARRTMAALKEAGIFDEQDFRSDLQTFKEALFIGPGRVFGKAIRGVGLEDEYEKLTGTNITKDILEPTGDNPEGQKVDYLRRHLPGGAGASAHAVGIGAQVALTIVSGGKTAAVGGKAATSLAPRVGLQTGGKGAKLAKTLGRVTGGEIPYAALDASSPGGISGGLTAAGLGAELGIELALPGIGKLLKAGRSVNVSDAFKKATGLNLTSTKQLDDYTKQGTDAAKVKTVKEAFNKDQLSDSIKADIKTSDSPSYAKELLSEQIGSLKDKELKRLADMTPAARKAALEHAAEPLGKYRPDQQSKPGAGQHSQLWADLDTAHKRLIEGKSPQLAPKTPKTSLSKPTEAPSTPKDVVKPPAKPKQPSPELKSITKAQTPKQAKSLSKFKNLDRPNAITKVDKYLKKATDEEALQTLASMTDMSATQLRKLIENAPNAKRTKINGRLKFTDKDMGFLEDIGYKPEFRRSAIRLSDNLRSKLRATNKPGFKVAQMIDQAAGQTAGRNLQVRQMLKTVNRQGKKKLITEELGQMMLSQKAHVGKQKKTTIRAMALEAERILKGSKVALTNPERKELRAIMSRYSDALEKTPLINESGFYNPSMANLGPMVDDALKFEANMGEVFNFMERKIPQGGSVGERLARWFRVSILSAPSTPVKILTSNLATALVRIPVENVGQIIARNITRLRRGDITPYQTASWSNIGKSLKNIFRIFTRKGFKDLKLEYKRVVDTKGAFRGNIDAISVVSEFDPVSFGKGRAGKAERWFVGGILSALSASDRPNRLLGMANVNERLLKGYVAKYNALFDKPLAKNYVNKIIDAKYSTSISPKSKKGALDALDRENALIRKVLAEEGREGAFDSTMTSFNKKIDQGGAEYAFAAATSVTSAAVERLIQGIEKAIPGSKLLTAIMAPVRRGPANLIDYSMSFAPGIGLAKLIFDIPFQKKIDPDLARTATEIVSERIVQQVVGTATLPIVGAHMYNSGMLTLERPSDNIGKDEADLAKKYSYSVKTPFGWLPLGNLPFVGPGLILGGTIAQANNNELPLGKDGYGGIATQYFAQLHQTVMDHPWLSFPTEFEKTLDRGDLRGMALDVGNDFVPNLVNFAARSVDPTTPDLKYSKWYERLILQSVPGLRNKIANREVLGKELKETDPFRRLFGFNYALNDDPVYEMVKEQADNRRDVSVSVGFDPISPSDVERMMPGNTPNERRDAFNEHFKGDNKLTDQDINQLNLLGEREIATEWERLHSLPQYQNGSIDERAILMDRAETAVRKAVVYKWAVSKGIEPSKLSREARMYLQGEEVDWQLEGIPRTRQEDLDKLKGDLNEARPAERPKLQRSIAKTEVEIEWESKDGGEKIIGDYSLSRNDLGRELERIARDKGSKAAEEHFLAVVEYGDRLMDAGALDTQSHKFRDNDGDLNWPSNYGAGIGDSKKLSSAASKSAISSLKKQPKATRSNIAGQKLYGNTYIR